MSDPARAFFGTPVRMFEPLEDVPTITARCEDPAPRLVELLAKPEPLTSAEWVELTAFERDAA